MEERGKHVKALETRPSLSENLTWYIRSFRTLSGRRGQGMNGGLPIPFSEIKAYLEVYPWFNTSLFINHMIALDMVYMKRNHDIIASKQTSPS